MKKWTICLLTLCLLASALILTTPRAQAAAHTDHCVCGGSAVGVYDHQCETAEWKPLSSVVTLSKVNWKDVPSGHYYLDGNVTVTAVTDGNAIGQVTKNADGTYRVDASREVSICLNGYTIATQVDRVFKGVYSGSTLNICDCSGDLVNGIWQWDGTIIGGTGGTGGITYTYANSTVNIYGGNITAKAGQTAATGGGLFYVAQDRAPVGDTVGKADPMYASTLNIYNGNLYGGSSAKTGGNINVIHHSNLNIYGGSVHDGTAAKEGGNIYIGTNTTVTIQNAAIYNGTAANEGGNIYTSAKTTVTVQNAAIYGGYPEVAKLITNGTESQEYSLSDAVKNHTAGSVIRLYRDLETDLAINKNIELDLNGHNLTGVSGNFTCFDSATEFGTDAGILSCTGNVTAKAGYTPVSADAGISFYRCTPEITHLSIDPANTAMGYKANISGKAVLEQIEEFGLEMWLEGYDHRQFSKREIDGQLTLRLKNILTEINTDEENAINADTPVYAFAYVVLKDGTKLCGDTVAYSFKDMLHAADDCYASFNDTQKASLQTMAGKYSRIMMTWDVENFHHAQGGMWQNFVLPKTSTKYVYKVVDGEKKTVNLRVIPEGSYVLTGNVDLQTATLGILKDTTVNLCLNGYTIEGDSRMMRVYGTLNLCDCHENTHEGTMTSSYSSSANSERHGAVFYTYYNSVFNLYGGNLKATGVLASSGVGAVSHEAQDDPDLVDAPPGVMNMYGGTLSGGTTTGNGGLLALYHGATFNMYGGEMYNGKAGGHGGAIHAGSNCQVNLYGGEIYGCSAEIGGGVYFTGNTRRHIGDTVICNNTGSDVYINGGEVTLSGDVQIDQLYQAHNAQLNPDELTTDARISITTERYGYLTDNTALKDVFTINGNLQLVEYNGKLLILENALNEKSLTDTFSVGHSQICINPVLPEKMAEGEGIPLSGYGDSNNRRAQGFESEIYYLYANATAITDEEGNTVLLITHDLQRPQEAITDVIRERISQATGVPVENIFLSASHSHSTPDLNNGDDLIDAYKILLYNKFTQAAVEAMACRVPATMKAGQVQDVNINGKHLNFSRHYSYYDTNGNIQYYGDNFGTAPTTNAEKATLRHVTEGDHSMQLIHIDRKGEKDVILCNWAAHPTMTGGATKKVLSSDYVGALRTYVQKNTECYFSFIQGAAGNMNPTSRISNEHAKYNGVTLSKDQYELYGQALASIVVDNLVSLESVATGKVQTSRTLYNAKVWKHDAEEVERAKALSALYYTLPEADRKAALAEYGFTSIYHAGSVTAKASMGDSQDLELNTFSIGADLAFFTAPGELWAETGMTVKDASDFKYTFTVGYTNGDWKYFPDGEAADGTYENYENYYCRFVLPDTTQEMIAYWKEALERLYNN